MFLYNSSPYPKRPLPRLLRKQRRVLGGDREQSLIQFFTIAFVNFPLPHSVFPVAFVLLSLDSSARDTSSRFFAHNDTNKTVADFIPFVSFLLLECNYLNLLLTGRPARRPCVLPRSHSCPLPVHNRCALPLFLDLHHLMCFCQVFPIMHAHQRPLRLQDVAHLALLLNPWIPRLILATRLVQLPLLKVQSQWVLNKCRDKTLFLVSI